MVQKCKVGITRSPTTRYMCWHDLLLWFKSEWCLKMFCLLSLMQLVIISIKKTDVLCMAPFLCEALSIWKSAFSFFLFVGVHILHTTWELAWNKHAMLTCRPQDNWNISAMLHLGICSIEHDMMALPRCLFTFPFSF